MKFKSMLVAALAAMTIASCQKSENVPDQEAQAEGQDIYATFSFRVNPELGTYAPTEDVNGSTAESKAQNITVYIFNKADGIYEGKAAYAGTDGQAGLDGTDNNTYRTGTVLVKSGVKLVYGVANAQASNISGALAALVPGTSTVAQLDSLTIHAGRELNGTIRPNDDPARGGYTTASNFLMTSFATEVTLPAPSLANGGVSTSNPYHVVSPSSVKLNRVVSKMLVKGLPSKVVYTPATAGTDEILVKKAASEGEVKYPGGSDFFNYLVNGTAKNAYAFQRVNSGVYEDPTNSPYPFASATMTDAVLLNDFNWVSAPTAASFTMHSMKKNLAASDYKGLNMSTEAVYTLENINGGSDLHKTTNQAMIAINYVPALVDVTTFPTDQSKWLPSITKTNALNANTSFFRAKRTRTTVTVSLSHTEIEETGYFATVADATAWQAIDYYTTGGEHIKSIGQTGATVTVASDGTITFGSGTVDTPLEYVNGLSYFIALVKPTAVVGLASNNAFSALRNYIHALNIKTIPGLGLHLSELPGKKDDPDASELYIDVDVEVVPWTVDEQEVDL